MARLNIYVPDDLAEKAKAAGLNVSAMAQEAIRAALDANSLNTWLDQMGPVRTTDTHDLVIEALDAVRDELRPTTDAPMANLVLDASAVVDILLEEPLGRAVAERIRDHVAHAPQHLEAEVLSALGRIYRAGRRTEIEIEAMFGRLVALPVHLHPIGPLLTGAWARRHQVRLADALYVELAAELGMLVTTDRKLRELPMIDVVSV